MDRRAPFPQADDFDKIIQILNIPSESQLSDNSFLVFYLSDINTERQANYYISACMYLGLVDSNRKFTTKGQIIREMNLPEKKLECVNIILSHRTFLEVYTKQLFYKKELSNDEIAELIKKEYPNYTEGIYNRRASTVKGWVSWINDTLS